MVKGVAQTIYNSKYFFSMKKLRAQGKHKEFCLDGSVATLVMLYWFQPSPKAIGAITKVQYPSLNTCQVRLVRNVWECNTKCATRGVLWSQVQSPLNVTFLLNLFCSLLCQALLRSLPESSVRENANVHIDLSGVVVNILFQSGRDYQLCMGHVF